MRIRLIAYLDRQRRRLVHRIDRFVLSRKVQRALGPWYYLLGNRGFDREQSAVLAGRAVFEASRTGIGKTNSLLRRNIHRLEKGLIMRPRRAVFGLGYIHDAMDKYESLCASAQSAPEGLGEEFQWFTDVLRDYFAATATAAELEDLRLKFRKLTDCLRELDARERKVPFEQSQRMETGISYEQFKLLCEQRKSVRWFRQEPVPREQTLKVLEMARYSPSACNRYPFFFKVFDEREKIEVVARLPGGTVGFAENFPVIIAIIGELRNYYGERDRHLIYVDASLAAMSVVLAAETLGLASCCINWPDIELFERRAEKVLQLEPDQRPVMFMALGYPDPGGMVAYSQKKPITEIVRFNEPLGSAD